MIYRFSKFFLAAMRKVQSLLNTASARGEAVFGKRTRVLADGGIVNLSTERQNIRLGSDCRIRGELLVHRNAGKIEVGDFLYVGPMSSIWSGNDVGVKIGDRVLISIGVLIHDTNSHPLDAEQRAEQTRLILTQGHPERQYDIRSAPIVIGNDVWIGARAFIGKGVKIGDRAIIGANAMVLADVAEDAIIGAGCVVRKEKS